MEKLSLIRVMVGTIVLYVSMTSMAVSGGDAMGKGKAVNVSNIELVGHHVFVQSIGKEDLDAAGLVYEEVPMVRYGRVQAVSKRHVLEEEARLGFGNGDIVAYRIAKFPTLQFNGGQVDVLKEEDILGKIVPTAKKD